MVAVTILLRILASSLRVLVPVIPVYMSNMGRALPKGEFILLPFICEVHIGPAMFPSGSKEEIMQLIRQAVLGLKGE